MCEDEVFGGDTMMAARQSLRIKPPRPIKHRRCLAEPLERRTLFAFGITQLTTTIPTTAGAVGPANVVASGDDVFFTATDPATGNIAVWSSNGTSSGTAPLTLPSGVSGTAAHLFAASGESTSAAASVFFDVGSAVFHSDGTSAGTAAVTVPDSILPSATLTVVGAFNGNVLVLADNGATQELYEQNAASDAPVDLGTIPGGLTPSDVSLTVGSMFHFALGGQLWSTGGAAGDVTELADTGATSLSDFTAVGSTLFFQAATSSNQQLWSSTGTAGGTADLLPTASGVGQLTPLGSQLLFVAQTSSDANGPVLWRSSGTAAGTAQFAAGGGPIHVGDLGVVSGKAFFVGFDTTGPSTAVLYTTTGNGLTAVKSLGNTATPGMLVSNSATVQTGDEAAFLAPGSNTASALWTSFGVTNTTEEQITGAPAGTLSTGGNDLLFDATATTATSPGQLYVLNGSASTGSGVPIATTGALLTAAVTAVSLPATFVPGDAGTVSLTITNSGNAAADGTLAVQLFLADQGSLTSSVPLTTPALSLLRVAVNVGGVRKLSARFSVPAGVPVGTDDVVAVLSPISNLTGEVSTDPVISTATAVASLSFGAVGTRRNVTLHTSDAAGNAVVYSLSSGGTGTLSTDADGGVTVSVTGSTPVSRLTIAAARGTTTSLAGLTVVGSLNQIAAPHVALTGTLSVDGDLRRLTLASATGATLNLNGSTPLAASLGVVSDSSLFSTDPITSLSAASWASGTLVAPSIGAFVDAGSFQGTLASAGNINTLLIRGDLTSSIILAGATLGADDALGGGDDTFAAATLRVLEVFGSVDGATIVAAGLSVTGDAFPPAAGDELLLNGGRIEVVSIRASLDPSARILAATLPTRAAVERQATPTAGDVNFSV